MHSRVSIAETAETILITYLKLLGMSSLALSLSAATSVADMSSSLAAIRQLSSRFQRSLVLAEVSSCYL